jgi:hypothetical protein
MLRPSTRDALRILLMTAVLCAGWQGLVSVRGLKADFGESNYTANRIRLEEYLLRPAAPRHVLIGSSLSGRLQPEFFAGTALEDFVTLGLDGSIPLVGIEALSRRPDLPEVVFIETYLMARPWKANDQVLVDGMESVGMKLAREIPLFRASHRPSSVLYNAIKQRRGLEESGGPPRTNAPASILPGPAWDAAPVDPEMLARWRGVMEELRGKGIRVVLVDLPMGETTMPGERRGADLPEMLVEEFGLRRLDVAREWFRRGWLPVYTDGRHLDAGSARWTARLLVELLE